MRMPCESGNSPPAENPCRMRKAMRVGALREAAQATEARVKVATWATKYARTPTRAATPAESGIAIRLASAYPVTTQPTVASEAPSSFWICGTATFTMLPSTACSIVPSSTPVRASPACSLVRRSTPVPSLAAADGAALRLSERSASEVESGGSAGAKRAIPHTCAGSPCGAMYGPGGFASGIV